jgi:serine-type D-Ala-D-Ala carboxypeptidase/endopeptidase (penicillin-binding protein 4)
VRVHPSPARKLTILLCGLWLLAALASTSASAATDLAGVQLDLGRQLQLAGPHDGAYVYDLTTKQAVFSQRASTMRPPASVEKLYTATAALEQLGASAQLQTAVYGVGTLAPGGIWQGDLYLRGGGDPTLAPDDLQRLSQALGEAGILRVDGSVLGDESRPVWRR